MLDYLEGIGVILVTMAVISFVVLFIIGVLAAIATVFGMWGKVFVALFLLFTLGGTAIGVWWTGLEELKNI